MNILILKNGKVEIRNVNGTMVATIGNGDVIFADFNDDQTLIVITTSKGKVEIRKPNGTIVSSSIGNGDATGARWYGNEIAISTKDGKTEIRNINGSIVKRF